MKHYNDPALKAELSQILSKIFNTSPNEIDKEIALFSKINPVIRNCLYYLSQIKDDQLRISAALDLEFLANFHKSPLKDHGHEKTSLKLGQKDSL